MRNRVEVGDVFVRAAHSLAWEKRTRKKEHDEHEWEDSLNRFR